MLYRSTLIIALSLATLLPFGCRASAGSAGIRATGDAAALRTELEALNDELLARLGRGDANGAAAFYTPDALLLPPDGRVIRGREAIRSFWAETVASTRILRSASNATDVRHDGRGLAGVVGRYALVTSTDGGAAVESRGTTLLVWRLTRDGWRIHADMWTVEPTNP
ncbi:MAG: YybH family protein [Gemmatimonadota bacterium]